MPAFRDSRIQRKALRQRLSKKRLTLENLEHRRVLSAVDWIGASSGSWDVASNWSTDAVPGQGDDVTIDTAAALTITIQSGDSITIGSLTTGANDTLSITGGALTVATGTSTLSGPLDMTGGSLTASGAGVNLGASGATSVSGASLYAESGGALALTKLTTLVSDASTLEANGLNSYLYFPSLATISHAGALTINAAGGGVINLGGLSQLVGGSDPGDLRLSDIGKAEVIAPTLTTLNHVDATLDGTDAQAAAAWMTFTNGNLSIAGGTYNLPQLASFGGSSLDLSGGASLTLPVLAIGAANTVNLTGNASLATTGDFTNNGALTVDAGSKVNVGEDFTQGSTGALNIQIAGSSASGRFGEVVVQNAATLGGALNVSLANGYTPQAGDDFRVMTFASVTNNFATVTGLGASLTENLRATSIDLLGPPVDTVESPIGRTLNTSIGQGFYSTVATFTDSNPSAQASQFVVAINWGDGTINGGNVGTSGNQFQAQGYHDYAHSGTFTVTTTIVDNGVATVVTGTAVVLPWSNGRINVTTSADTHAANAATSPEDSAGNISLRSAIEYLNTTGQANDTIAFDGNYVRTPLQLTLGPIEIDTSMTIDGGGVYQLAISQATPGAAQLFQIDRLDKNSLPVAVTISNLTLSPNPLPANNAAVVENQGALTVNNVNFVSSLAYAPAIGDTVTLVSGGGGLTGSIAINGSAISNKTDDSGLSNNGNIYPFKPNFTPDGLAFTFDTNAVLAVDGSATIRTTPPAPAQDLVGDWRFQESNVGQAATGQIIDSSANGLNGSPLGDPVYSANVPFAAVPQTGQSDKESLQFNGANQVFVPDSAALQLTHSLTLEALVNVTAAPQNYQGYIVFRGDDRGSLDPYTLSINGSGNNLRADFQIDDASNNATNVSAPIPGLNQWLDIAGTLDAATGAMRLYINGVEAASTVTSVRPFATLDPTKSPGLGIGNTQSGNYHSYFQGLINEVRIYDVALTPGQFLDSTPGNLVVTDGGAPLLNEPAANLSSLTLDGSSGSGTIDLTVSATVPITVHGAAPGGTLLLPDFGNLSVTYTASSGYSGTWSNTGGQTVTFDGIQTLEKKVQTLPTSTVAPLPAASPASFTVSWSGEDAGGPGIGGYNVFVSDNGGPFTAWLSGTTQTSATWNGKLGHTYAFYSVTVDVAGQSQAIPTAAQATTQSILGEPNAIYVTAVYHDVLDRAPDASGLVYWTDLLDRGTAVGSVAMAIAHSDEYYANFVIKPDYLNLLGRAANDIDLSYWSAKMQAGLTDQQLAAEFISSAEFFQTAGGTNADWVQAVYKQLLGRAASADDVSYWVQQLSGGATLASVAQKIANSQENNAQLIKNDYFHYLGRQADDVGLAYWLGQFAAGETNEDVIAGFTGSAEYYREHSS